MSNKSSVVIVERKEEGREKRKEGRERGREVGFIKSRFLPLGILVVGCIYGVPCFPVLMFCSVRGLCVFTETLTGFESRLGTGIEVFRLREEGWD